MTTIVSVSDPYDRLAPFYDLMWGALLQPGRRVAMMRLAPRPGERILELGVGTGFALGTYAKGCEVVGIDVSAPMIARANARRRRRGLQHVALCRMDGAALAFHDRSFDAVYAPYVMNQVANPVAVAAEMLRVCRAGGRLVLLNHFDHENESKTLVTRVAGAAVAKMTGVNWGLSFSDFVRRTGLRVQSIDGVNFGHVSSVVVCRT